MDMAGVVLIPIIAIELLREYKDCWFFNFILTQIIH
jgi:hypothetical protein